MTRAFVFFLFFLSGFSALLYQVVWQRMLAIFSGVDVYSITIIVAAFMAGLGCGNLAGGHLADRLRARWCIPVFAGCEAAIGAFALASRWLYYDVAYLRFAQLSESPALLAAVLFAGLLPPTFLMGMSLPLLARALVRGVETAPRTVGALYAVNTLGAAAGAFATAWLLMRTLGFESSLWLGAAGNGLCALGALAAAPRLARGAPAGAAAPVGPATPPERFGVSHWLAIYALSGFVALSLEILWFRVIGVLMKPTAFSFANLLGIYVGGLALGTFAGLRGAERSPRPAATFFGLQAAAALYAGLALAALVAVLPAWKPLWEHVSGYDPLAIGPALDALRGRLAGAALPAEAAARLGRFALLYGLVPAALVAPATFCMGMSFPYLQRVVQTDESRLGRRVGWLQTANIAGSMLGSILCGWLLLALLGSSATLRLLVAAGGIFLLLGLRLRFEQRGGLAAAAAVLVVAAVIAAVPGADRLWSTLHGTTPERVVFAEDGSGLALLQDGDDASAQTSVFVNGLGQSWVPFGGTHTMLGALPVLLHPDPRRVAVIGLGSGDTLHATGGRREVERVVCFELIGGLERSLREHQRRRPYAGLAALFSDPRYSIATADGRAALMHRDDRFDVIEADAIRPNSAYAGNLYSVEYFRLLRERLAPGGYAVTWSPTERVFRSFARVFRHVLWIDDILIGSDAPIDFDRERLLARARDPFTRAWFRDAGVDIEELVRELLRQPVRRHPRGANWGLADYNSDLFPRDEFLVPERGVRRVRD